MHFALRQGLSFCEIGERFVFLDLFKQRYFVLQAETELQFRHLCSHGEDRTEPALIQALSQTGLLVPASAPRELRSCGRPPLPQSSLVDQKLEVSTKAALDAACRLAAASFGTRLLPLSLSISRLQRRKVVAARRPEPRHDLLSGTAAAFQKAGLILPPLDQCLSRSIALCGALLGQGFTPELVVGVRLNPFRAHCWVQDGPTLLNEYVDEARAFTPILVV